MRFYRKFCEQIDDHLEELAAMDRFKSFATNPQNDNHSNLWILGFVVLVGIIVYAPSLSSRSSTPSNTPPSLPSLQIAP